VIWEGEFEDKRRMGREALRNWKKLGYIYLIRTCKIPIRIHWVPRARENYFRGEGKKVGQAENRDFLNDVMDD